MNSFYLDAIKRFEGYAPQAKWDYAQHSNGFGTRALYPGELIDRAEAERRFSDEIAQARAIVERYAGDMDEGTKAALTSLTYNAGTKWTSSGLGEAVRRGDLDAVRDLFREYNKAGGQILPGLVERRAAEALWIGSQVDGKNRSDDLQASLGAAPPSTKTNDVLAGFGAASTFGPQYPIIDKSAPRVEAAQPAALASSLAGRSDVLPVTGTNMDEQVRLLLRQLAGDHLVNRRVAESLQLPLPRARDDQAGQLQSKRSQEAPQVDNA